MADEDSPIEQRHASSNGGFRHVVSTAVSTFSETRFVSRVHAALLLVSYLLTLAFGHRLTNVFALVPAKVLFRFHVWSLVSFALVEQHLLPLILNMVIIFATSRLVFSVWSLKRFLIVASCLSAVVGATVCLLSFMIYLALSAVTALEFLYDIFYHVPYSGGAILSGLFAILAKLHLPDRAILHPFVRGKHAPALCAFLLAAVTLPLGHWDQPLLYVLSTFFAWVYLRFLARPEGLIGSSPSGLSASGGRGHRGDAFAFDTFFPEAWRPALQPLSARFYRLGTVLRIVPRVIEVSPRVFDDDIASTAVHDVRVPASSLFAHDDAVGIDRGHSTVVAAGSTAVSAAAALGEADLEIERRMRKREETAVSMNAPSAPDGPSAGRTDENQVLRPIDSSEALVAAFPATPLRGLKHETAGSLDTPQG